ncbi:MAG: SEC-C metal-binding domain-containing protein, partial [Patescibacteria group bacterium]
FKIDFEKIAPAKIVAPQIIRNMRTNEDEVEAQLSGGGRTTDNPVIVKINAAQSHSSAKTSFPKVGRNDPCPCGSGKKYKKCHDV